MSVVAVEVNHRRPALRFPRPHEFPVGTRVLICWNGARAGNGDGRPGGDAEIDYARPLAGPIALWPDGAQPHLFGGGFGGGGFASPGARPWDAMGFGRGPFGIGAFGAGGGFWSWEFPFQMRDGLYRLDLLLVDAVGNRQEPPGSRIDLTVAALPRPAAHLSVRVEDEDLVVAWEASPDLME